MGQVPEQTWQRGHPPSFRLPQEQQPLPFPPFPFPLLASRISKRRLCSLAPSCLRVHLGGRSNRQAIKFYFNYFTSMQVHVNILQGVELVCLGAPPLPEPCCGHLLCPSLSLSLLPAKGQLALIRGALRRQGRGRCGCVAKQLSQARACSRSPSFGLPSSNSFSLLALSKSVCKEERSGCYPPRISSHISLSFLRKGVVCFKKRRQKSVGEDGAG